MYWEPIPENERRSALNALRSMGITMVEVTFSGGNDEGGADGIAANNAKGDLVEIPTSKAYRARTFNPNTRKWVQGEWETWSVVNGTRTVRPATNDEITWSQVRAVLEHPVYEKYGSFAGDFYAEGTVTWDIIAGTHEIHGQESYTEWESY